MKNIAIYYRCSTDKQDLLSQIDAVEKWIRALPVEKRPKNIRQFQDEGRSGADNGRPGFQTMLEEARAGAFDTIICYRLDRLTRSTYTALRTIMDLNELGISFVSTSQPILNLEHDSPFRLTMLAAFAEIAEIERDAIVSRVRAGVEAARRRGVKFGRPFLSEKKKELIFELHQNGMNKTMIAHTARVSRQSVWRILKDHPDA